MKKDLTKLSTQALNTVFAHLSDSEKDVLWIRSANDEKQLYISPSYKNIWGRECATLYERPADWVNTLLPDDIYPITPQMNARFDGVTNTVYYRIIHPQQEIQYIKDFSFALHNEQNLHFVTAGVSKLLTSEQWNNEVKQLNAQKKINGLANLESPFLDLLEKEAHQLTTHVPSEPGYVIETDKKTIHLTKREAQCLYFLAQGFLGKIIADFLHLSPRTIEDHITRLKTKMQCRTRVEILSKIHNLNEIHNWRFEIKK